MHVDEGAKVERGDAVIAVECMKQQHDIISPVAGVVRFQVTLGEVIEQDQLLAEIETE